MLTGLLAGGGGPADVDGQISELEQVMRRTSICGLGQVALGPVMSVVGLARGAGGAQNGQGAGGAQNGQGAGGAQNGQGAGGAQKGQSGDGA
jgi:hypothetical protein